MNYKKILRRINLLAQEMSELKDTELQAKTKDFRAAIKRGVKEKDLVVEAFAVVREAAHRVLGLFATDEQVLGALILCEGRIAEIKTGEGKSLVATMPLYLKALYLDTVFLITTNDYLAQRDYERIGCVYRWLGLTVSNGSREIASDSSFEDHVKSLTRKKEVYSANIVYHSNGGLGFDYLIDGLADLPENRYMPTLRYALIDEVDEVLLDSAVQPLIISGGSKLQSNYYHLADGFVKILTAEKHYKMNPEKTQVWFTESGLEEAKSYFSLEDLLEVTHFSLYQHLVLALKANFTLRKNKDYVVQEGKVHLLNSRDGRILEGVTMQSGLHQAVEAKEGVDLTTETQAITSITFQNLFRQFQQLAGMSGTAKVAENEFIDTYNLTVKKVKTHRKSIRRDHPAVQYVTFESKLKGALEKIQELYEQKRPLLIITGSVDASALFSTHLLNLGIPHNVLNAKSSVKEAQIISEAGEYGAVTVSTSMAGRGTDIKLSSEAIKAGGLAVVITERMMNKRIELQAKGRTGRQGEPGDTYVFESLEDELIRQFAQDKVQSYYDKHKGKVEHFRKRSLRRVFLRAQKVSEDQAWSSRARAVKFDEVLKLQKKQVEISRSRILDLEDISQALDILKESTLQVANQYFTQVENKSSWSFQRFMLDYVDYNFKMDSYTQVRRDVKGKVAFVDSYLAQHMKEKQETLKDDKVFLKFLKVCLLKAIDTGWSGQIDALTQLERAVERRSMSQKKPLLEFERESKKTYAYNREKVAELMLKNCALSLLQVKKKQLIVTFP